VQLFRSEGGKLVEEVELVVVDDRGVRTPRPALPPGLAWADGDASDPAAPAMFRMPTIVNRPVEVTRREEDPENPGGLRKVPAVTEWPFVEEEPFVLGTDVQTKQPVTLDVEQRTTGCYLVGLTGTGKTTSLANMALHDIRQGRGVCVLDPHVKVDGLTNTILANIPQHRWGDVMLLDLTERERPARLNIFECADPADDDAVSQVAAQAVQVFKKVWAVGKDASWGPRLEDLLLNAAITLTRHRLSLGELLPLLTDEAYRRSLVGSLDDPVVRNYWEREYPSAEREQREVRAAVTNKVRQFLLDTALRRIVGEPGSTIDFGAILRERRILLVQLDIGRETATSLLGSLVVGRLLHAATEERDVPFGLFADEYQRFDTPVFGTLLNEARKYGVLTVMAHQQRALLDPERRALPMGARNKVVFQVSGADADELAGEFDHTPPSAEKVQRPVTKPAMKEWEEEVWEPPSAKEEYERVLGQLDEVLRDAELLCAVFVERLVYERRREDRAPDALTDLDSLLRGLRDTCRGVAGRKQIHERLNSWLGPKSGVIAVPSRGSPPRPGGRAYRLPSAVPSRAEEAFGRLAKGGNRWESGNLRIGPVPDAAASRLPEEFAAAFRPYREKALYWFYPNQLFPEDWKERVIACQGRHDGTDEQRWYWEGSLFPEFIPWLIDKAEGYRRRIVGLVEQQTFLWEHRRRMEPRSEYLGYELPVRDEQFSGVGRYGIETTPVQRYQWVDGPRMSNADVHGQISNELANLPRFRAKVKLMGKAEGDKPREHTIATLPLQGEEATSATAQQRVRQVKQLSAGVYGRPLPARATAQPATPPALLELSAADEEPEGRLGERPPTEPPRLPRRSGPPPFRRRDP